MKTKIKPCGHYVLVKPEVIKKKTDGGIILSKGMVNQENTAKVRGVIIDIGQNAWKAFNQGEPDGIGKPWAKVGSKVIFKRHASDKIEDEDNLDEEGDPQLYFLMTDENILAVIEE